MKIELLKIGQTFMFKNLNDAIMQGIPWTEGIFQICKYNQESNWGYDVYFIRLTPHPSNFQYGVRKGTDVIVMSKLKHKRVRHHSRRFKCTTKSS